MVLGALKIVASRYCLMFLIVVLLLLTHSMMYSICSLLIFRNFFFTNSCGYVLLAIVIVSFLEQIVSTIDEIKDDYLDYQKKKDDAYETTVLSIKDGSIVNFPFQKNTCSELLNVACKEHELYIFGHSLNVSDRDILKFFICNDNEQTKIFYYRESSDDKEALGKTIRNLIKIIGQDELIRRTGGLHKTIEFIPQSLKKE